LFKPHDRKQEEASQAKTKSMAEKAAAGKKRQQQAKKGSSSGKQLGELPKNESEKRRQEKVDKQNCQM
jgi:hypothetical protein